MENDDVERFRHRLRAAGTTVPDELIPIVATFAAPLLSALDADHNIPIDLDQAYLVRANFSKQADTNALTDGSFQAAFLYGANFSGVNLTNAKFGGSYMADWDSYGKSWTGPGDDYDNTRWLNVVDLPEPDSPTMPSVRPCSKVKLTPSTARTSPTRLRKTTPLVSG